MANYLYKPKRRLTSLLLLPLLFLMLGTAAKAENMQVTVGTLDGTTAYFPVNRNRDYIHSEILYPADCLSALGEGTITSVSFCGYSSVSMTAEYELYLSVTDLNVAPTSPSDLSSMTKVFEGSATISQRESSDRGEILKFELQTPFPYEEGQSLLLTVISKNPSVEMDDAHFDYQKVSGACGFNYSEGANFYSGASWTNMRLQLILGFEGSANQKHEVTIGSGSNSHNYVPLGTGYKYGVSETVYKASDLGMETGSMIKELTYKGWSGATLSRNVEVWMQNTDDELVGGVIPQGDEASMTKVYEGTVEITPAGAYNNFVPIMTLKLDSPFKYEGENLRVLVKSHSEDTSSQVYFADDSSYSGWALYEVDDNEITASLSKYYYGIPVTQFTYTDPEEEPQPEMEPVFTITTEKELGSWFGFTVWTNVDPEAEGGPEDPAGGICYDMGDGNIVQRPFPGTLSINDEVKGNTIKIYRCNPDVGVEFFSCYDNGVSAIDIKEPMLNTLNLSDNLLESVDLSVCENLEQLVLTGNKFVKFEYSNPKLKHLSIKQNLLEQILISDCTSLEYLDVSVNLLRAPSWIAFPATQTLKTLNISYNNLYSIDVSGYSALEALYCNSNRFEALDVTKNPKLKVLSANFQGIKSVNLSQCPDLEDVNLAGTMISSLNLVKNTKLRSLDVSLTSLAELNTNSNTALETLKAGKCALTYLDLYDNTALKHLEYPSNKLASVDLSRNTKLNYLDCSDNGVEKLDISALAALDSLYCSRNKLYGLNLSAAKSLKVLNCSSNNFDKLEIKDLNTLVSVDCSDNNLSTLSVADMTELLSLNVSSNDMDAATLENLFGELPDINNVTINEDELAWKGVLNYKNNPGSGEADTEVLTAKGWKYDYVADMLGDASAMFVLPDNMYKSRYIFSIITGDEKIYVDWGNGVKEEYITETYPGAYTNPSGVVEGTVVKIYAPQATTLAVSNSGIESLSTRNMPELDYLACSGNSLIELDLSANTKIAHLDCDNNPLTSLTLPENTVLEALSCRSTLLRNVDFSSMPELQELLVDSNRLTSIDLASSTKLRYLSASLNELESIDLTNCPALEELYLGYNNLTEIDLSKNTEINHVSISHNKLQRFDATVIPQAQYIQVPHNEITEIKLNNEECVELLAGNNKFTEIDLTSLITVGTLELTNCALTELDLSKCTNLYQVFVYGNKISDVKFPKNPISRLALFNAADNCLTSLEYDKMPNLGELILRRNNLSGTVDLSALGSLTYLDVNTNEIEKLTLASSVPLEALYVQYNKLSTLTVPSSSCVIIDATRNNLASINISACSELLALFLDFNRLSSLNVDGKSKLVGLSIRQNKLGQRTLDDIYDKLPDITGQTIAPEYASWMSYLNISGNPGAAESNTALAMSKGWKVVDGEELPELRNMTINVSDADGNPLTDVSFKLLLDGETYSLTPTSAENGVYVFKNFEVFTSYDYNIIVECDGYTSQTVLAEGLADGDITLDVVLSKVVGIDSVVDGSIIYGGNGCIVVKTSNPMDVVVYDLTGRQVATATADSTLVIDGLARGIYIVNGKKVVVR